MYVLFHFFFWSGFITLILRFVTRVTDVFGKRRAERNSFLHPVSPEGPRRHIFQRFKRSICPSCLEAMGIPVAGWWFSNYDFSLIYLTF